MLLAFVFGGLGFEFCLFVAGWRHALRSEWPFIIIITQGIQKQLALRFLIFCCSISVYGAVRARTIDYYLCLVLSLKLTSVSTVSSLQCGDWVKPPLDGKTFKSNVSAKGPGTPWTAT